MQPVLNHATSIESRNQCLITQPVFNHAISVESRAHGESRNQWWITQPVVNHATSGESQKYMKPIGLINILNLVTVLNLYLNFLNGQVH